MLGPAKLVAATLVMMVQDAPVPQGLFQGPRPPNCLLNPEIRDVMQSRQAVPPFRAVAEAMREGGDLVAIRLCRSPDPQLVYDVSVLRLDGRLVHVIIDASTGRTVPNRHEP